MAKHLTVSDFMSLKITSVLIDQTMDNICNIMYEKNISCVMVLQNELPVGIITERNIVHFLAANAEVPHQQVTAKALIPPRLVTIEEDDSLFEAMVLCRSQRVKHLAVVDKTKKLTGIITHSDLVDANFAQIEQQAALLGEHDSATKQEEINARLLEMTLTDALMEVGNRRAMEIDLKQTHELSTRYQRPYSIALIDVDYFKKFNDFYGHLAGDKALKAIAQCLKDSVRNVDRIYRYGGEELLVLMPETLGDAATIVAKRIIDAISQTGIDHEKSPFGTLTASVGIAAIENFASNNAEDLLEKNLAAISHDASQPEWQKLIANADTVLYKAKENGRSQYMLFDSSGEAASAQQQKSA